MRSPCRELRTPRDHAAPSSSRGRGSRPISASSSTRIPRSSGRPSPTLRRARRQPRRDARTRRASALATGVGRGHSRSRRRTARPSCTAPCGCPTDFDPSRRYPVLDWIYPGPQRGQTPERAADATGPNSSRSAMPQAFAEIGCIVVNVDGRGTPLRSKAFHDLSYGNLRDPGCLEDHVACLRQLAERHDFITLDRVGIMGHSARRLCDGARARRASRLLPCRRVERRATTTSAATASPGPRSTRDRSARAITIGAANKHFVGAITGKLLLAHRRDGRQRASRADASSSSTR